MAQWKPAFAGMTRSFEPKASLRVLCACVVRFLRLRREPRTDGAGLSDADLSAKVSATAGVQGQALRPCRLWIPAFAGMTARSGNSFRNSCKARGKSARASIPRHARSPQQRTRAPVGTAADLERGHEAAGVLINANLGMAVLVPVVHSLAMIAAGGILAWLVYRYLGLKFLSRSWFNLDATWASSLILVGALSLSISLASRH
jgi:hypothetical protein